MTSVAVICTANRCRSVMAHAILFDEVSKRSLPVNVYSAGILDFSRQPPLTETLRTCLRFETPPPKETPTWVRQLPLASINRFLVMEEDHAGALMNDYGILPDRISLLGTFDPQHRGAEIADPFGHSDEVYRDSYLLIRDCIISYLDSSDDLTPTQ